MMFPLKHFPLPKACQLLALGLCCTAPGILEASDHSDMPQLGEIGRHDARITDLYAFVRGDRLVLAMCLNPAVPPTAPAYFFSSDLTVRFHLDHHTPVRFDHAEDLALYGGTILRPDRISEDILLEITFDREGHPRLASKGLSRSGRRAVQLFAGLVDDPFIRGPRIGRNVAAVVVELPLAAVLGSQSTLLIWGTTKVPEVRGHMADHAGRALRSMFPENDAFNGLRPRDQFKQLGLVPDVILYDTSRPALHPNGRDLADDVMDMVNDPRVMASDSPFPDSNDVPFREVFPYLALPHPPPAP